MSTDDPYLATLMAIAAELQQIRLELQRQNPRSDHSDRDPAYTCDACGAELADEQAATTHAKTDHNAPPGAWRSIITPNEP